ncbi:unnamed protein product (macronuclear) [Paramecium tetraurelia]|uniref:Transmembrane protein n=1 Tax=Paramecium tetraurelia TaxID=5888 RepID=A0BM84_PARTE|nr:uncharacterized protein GSPATT00030285001 [Paramecium tetraurelia]CAK59651.1 unnamed protein product [Paramecium tetraurelia]|eukprot:XP_001427049.1 hypothetical protein (macronuclear) [Paramecium tetraurelia strain d4-2]
MHYLIKQLCKLSSISPSDKYSLFRYSNRLRHDSNQKLDNRKLTQIQYKSQEQLFYGRVLDTQMATCLKIVMLSQNSKDLRLLSLATEILVVRRCGTQIFVQLEESFHQNDINSIGFLYSCINIPSPAQDIKCCNLFSCIPSNFYHHPHAQHVQIVEQFLHSPQLLNQVHLSFMLILLIFAFLSCKILICTANQIILHYLYYFFCLKFDKGDDSIKKKYIKIFSVQFKSMIIIFLQSKFYIQTQFNLVQKLLTQKDKIVEQFSIPVFP